MRVYTNGYLMVLLAYYECIGDGNVKNNTKVFLPVLVLRFYNDKPPEV
jgi:hypothetical protein